jgi:hypothetical protein
MEKIEAFLNKKDDVHPDFEFGVLEFNTFGKMVQNYSRFYRYMISK